MSIIINNIDIIKFEVGEFWLVWEPIREMSSRATHPGDADSQLLSHLTEPLWADPILQSCIGAHELISTNKEKKKAQVANDLLNLPPKPFHTWKKPPPPCARNKKAPEKCPLLLLSI